MWTANWWILPKRAPLEFLQGAGNIIPGLEEELYGMELGESKNVIVSAEDGYGEFDPDAFVDVPRAHSGGNPPGAGASNCGAR